MLNIIYIHTIHYNNTKLNTNRDKKQNRQTKSNDHKMTDKVRPQKRKIPLLDRSNA